MNKLESLKIREKSLQDKLERIPRTFTKHTQAVATERAKRMLSEVQAAIQKEQETEASKTEGTPQS